MHSSGGGRPPRCLPQLHQLSGSSVAEHAAPGRARCGARRCAASQGAGAPGTKRARICPATASCHLAATIGQWPGLQPGPCHHQPRCSRSWGLKAFIQHFSPPRTSAMFYLAAINCAATASTQAAAIVIKLSIQVSKRLSVICYRFLGSLRLSNANI